MRQPWFAVVLIVLLAAGCAKPSATPADPTRAEALEASALVERARLTVEQFAADPQFGDNFRGLARRARGIFVAPQVLRGAFIVGAAGGNALLVARDSRTGKWNGPAFYSIGEVSLGLQAGADASEVVLLAMTERGVTALLSRSMKLGGEVSVAVGPAGGGAAVATMNLSADILSYLRARGLYAGVSLQGAVVTTRDGWNRAYYGRDVAPVDILIRGELSNPDAAALLTAVEKVASAP
jgi:lipid-binding SYLF domain-containing protein